MLSCKKPVDSDSASNAEDTVKNGKKHTSSPPIENTSYIAIFQENFS